MPSDTDHVRVEHAFHHTTDLRHMQPKHYQAKPRGVLPLMTFSLSIQTAHEVR